MILIDYDIIKLHSMCTYLLAFPQNMTPDYLLVKYIEFTNVFSLNAGDLKNGRRKSK